MRRPKRPNSTACKANEAASQIGYREPGGLPGRGSRMNAASLERPTQESGLMARATLAVAILCAVGACAPVTRPGPQAPSPSVHPAAFTQVGLASWYGSAHAGHPTASGELFDPSAM